MKILSILIIVFFQCDVFASEVADFSLVDYHTGQTITLSELTKEKKVLLNFWASWCTSCAKEIPELEQLKKKNPGVVFIGINAGDKKKKIKKFLKKFGFSYQILMDKDKSYSKQIGVLSLPQSMIIGKNREILYQSDKPPKEF